MNGLQLNVGWILIAHHLRENWPTLKRLGGEEAKRRLSEKLRAKFERNVPKIAVKMAAEGWTLQVKPAPDVIRDAQYRLWRTLFSGVIADAFRDSHEDAIRGMVGEVAVDTPLEALVRRVAEAEVELTF